MLLVSPPASLVLVALLCLGNTTRAVAPWLLPPFVGLVWASIVGTDVLVVLVAQEAPVLMLLATVILVVVKPF